MIVFDDLHGGDLPVSAALEPCGSSPCQLVSGSAGNNTLPSEGRQVLTKAISPALS